jgi:hypothetical protein
MTSKKYTLNSDDMCSMYIDILGYGGIYREDINGDFEVSLNVDILKEILHHLIIRIEELEKRIDNENTDHNIK